MQLKDGCRSWTLNEKNLILNLYYKSPTAYIHFYVHKKLIYLGHQLPINHWIS